MTCSDITLASKHLFIFDMDGTIYLGAQVFPFARDFILHLRQSGRRVLFFTNNASHNPDFYLSKLSAMGFEPSRDELLTSGDVTLAYLNSDCPGKTVFLVGTPQLAAQFRSSGILLADEDGAYRGKDADIVVTSFDTTLVYRRLDTACRLIRGGAKYLSTHPDFNCPVEGGFIPDSGAIAAFVTASTGVTPVYFGKPYPQTAQMISAITGVPAADTVVFGDRLYTDIALGRRSGIFAVLVLTGETRPEDLAAAKPDEQPDLVLPSLAQADRLIFDKS